MSYSKSKDSEPFSWKIFMKFVGSAGSLVAVSFIDPGNYSTNLAASSFGYSLLFVVFICNVMAVIFQSLCIKLGVVTGYDLAESCNKYFNKYINFGLYILCEFAIIATDLAEIIGTAIALQLLFGLNIVWGILLTGVDVLFILLFFKAKFLKYFERFTFLLILCIAICFSILVFKTTSDWSGVFYGYIPSLVIFESNKSLYLSLGIVGSMIMPHTFFLHSNLVKYRSSRQGQIGDIVEIEVTNDKNKNTNNLTYKNRHIPSILRYFYLDSILSLCFALLINSSILISAASAFTSRGIETDSLSKAFFLFDQILGKASAILFAIALLLSGQSSTITGTLTGQIIMSGFLENKFTIKPWIRRLISRSIAIIPAIIVAVTSGEEGITNLLILSQVILSLALPFYIWPLIYFTSNKKIMTINCIKYQKHTDSVTFVDDSTLNNEIEESVDFSNSLFMKIISGILGIILTGLNIYLLTSIKNIFSN
jgi:manganese transport protein